MLYILRLTNGDCIVLLASDEQDARRSASRRDSLQGEGIVSIRPLDEFEVKLSPTEVGGLEIAGWNDGVLNSILANEYPLLYDGYRHANAQPFAARNPQTTPLQHLRAEFEKNTEIIRQALVRERSRFAKGRRSAQERPLTKEQPRTKEESQPLVRAVRGQK
jgi:hypothetical protein